MKKLMRSAIGLLALALLIPVLPGHCFAIAEAREISGMDLVSSQEGFANCWKLFDGDCHQAITVEKGSRLTLRSPNGFGSAYLIFDEAPGAYTLTDEGSGESRTFGESGFLHEYLDLEAAFQNAPKALTLSFPNAHVRLNEISLFTSGRVPKSVQKWEPAEDGQIDLMLFPTHCDDEHLFFAGLLPLYAGERDFNVLVAYLTDHSNTGTLRRHEMLDGLWAVGVKTYPVLGPFSDHYSRSKSAAYALHRKDGLSDTDLLAYVVGLLRRYRPQAAVGHDPNGEYGHGQHMLYSELLCKGVAAAADPAAFPESAERWGVWNTPKTYLHLWPENTIFMDYDQPLRAFHSMTAFQVSQNLGFPCHKSQYWGFAWYIADHQAAVDIPKYSPCAFGLYRSTVGPDRRAGELFQNLIPYDDQNVLSQAVSAGKLSLHRLRDHTAAAVRSQSSLRQETQAEKALQRTEAERLHQTRRSLLISVLLFGGILALILLYLNKKEQNKNF